MPTHWLCFPISVIPSTPDVIRIIFTVLKPARTARVSPNSFNQFLKMIFSCLHAKMTVSQSVPPCGGIVCEGCQPTQSTIKSHAQLSPPDHIWKWISSQVCRCCALLSKPNRGHWSVKVSLFQEKRLLSADSTMWSRSNAEVQSFIVLSSNTSCTTRSLPKYNCNFTLPHRCTEDFTQQLTRIQNLWIVYVGVKLPVFLLT